MDAYRRPLTPPLVIDPAALLRQGGSSPPMAKPQHRTPEYRAAYAQVVQAQAAGHVLWCVEPICKYPTRHIAPSHRASVSHDTTGLVILGPSHLSCNLSEAATRGNHIRAAKRTRWVL